MGAHFAHGQHDKTAADFGMLGIRRQQPSPRRLLLEQKANGALNRCDCNVGQAARHPHHRPDAADIAQRDQQRRFGFHPPQRRHHLGLAGRSSNVSHRSVDQRRKVTVGIGLQQTHGAARVGTHQVEQIRRGFRDALKDRFGLRERGGYVLECSSGLRRDIAQPVRKPPLGVFGCKQFRSGHETGRQGGLVRTAHLS